MYISRTKDKLLDAIEGREHCHAVVMDASKPDSVEKGTEESISLLGGGSVDLVVYCPGVSCSFHCLFARISLILNDITTS